MSDNQQPDLEQWKDLFSTVDVSPKAFFPDDIYYPDEMRGLDVEKFLSFCQEVNEGNFLEDYEYPEFPLLNEQEFKQFELALNRKLPEGYRYYCQVFGTGGFGDLICIQCPDIRSIEKFLENSQSSLLACLDSFQYEEIPTDELEQLVENSLVFGDRDHLVIFIFDLNSYNDEDRSCDIYGLRFDCDDCYVRKVGRDFFKFIRDEIIGEGLRRFPELVPTDDEDLASNWFEYKGTTFMPFPRLEPPESEECS